MRVLVLVGHGGVPKDVPRAWVREMKQLSRKATAGDRAAAAAAHEIDERIRNHPRTDETDPYGAGLRALAAQLQTKLDPWRVVVAYNEFCAPTIEAAVDAAVADGATEIQVMTTMITPGGSHSEIDIPDALARARETHPDVAIHFVWPLDLDVVADMYASCLTNVVA